MDNINKFAFAEKVTVIPAAVLAAAGGLALKAHSVACGTLSGAECLLQVTAGDLPLIGFLLALVCGSPFLRLRLLRIVFYFAALFTSSIYLLDCYLIQLFNERLSIDDLLKYSGGGEIILSFIGPVQLAAAAGIAAVWLLHVKLKRRTAAVSALAGVTLLFAGGLLTPASAPLLRYTTSPIQILRALAAERPNVQPPYTKAQIDFFSKQFSPQVEVSTPAPNANVVLLVVESLTAVDSYRTSGLGNRLAEFDRAGSDGVVFTNFFANYADSEGGLISLVSAVPPLPFPGSTRNLFLSYSIADSAADAFKRRGYSTEFLLAHSIWWNNMIMYIREIGFDMFNGRDEIPLLKSAPRFAFNSPADGVLYRQLLDDIGARTSTGTPFFIVAVTVSSHMPWNDPAGEGNDEDHVWRYVDRSFGEFYNRLRDSGFFSNGVLVITADHHKMTKISVDEQNKYGASAGARIPLFVIGAGIPAGRIDDRLFQQSDLLRMLGRVPEEKQPLSRNIVFVERFTSPELRITHPGDITIFDQTDGGKTGYRGFVSGSKLDWIGIEPPYGRKIAEAIHAQRSYLQNLRATALRTCDVVPTDGLTAGTDSGLSLEIYAGPEINGKLSPASHRFAAGHDVQSVNLPDLHASFKERQYNYALQFDGFLVAEQPGQYWFRVESDDGTCLLIDSDQVIDANQPKAFGPVDNSIYLEPGVHRIVLRYFQLQGPAGVVLSWIPPGRTDWEPIPEMAFRRGIKQ